MLLLLQRRPVRELTRAMPFVSDYCGMEPVAGTCHCTLHASIGTEAGDVVVASKCTR
jgi:hypothetical protein